MSKFNYQIDYQFLNNQQSEKIDTYLTPWTKDQRHIFKQVHGRNIKIIDAHNEKIKKKGTVSDGSESFDGGLVFHHGVVMIKTADCVPVLLQNAEEGWVAALHCSWRSTQQGIIDHFFSSLKKASLTRNQTIDLSKTQAIIGPAICENCYEVKPDLINQFDPFFSQNPDLYQNDFFIEKKGQKNQYLFNLKKLLIKILHNNRISIDNIKIKSECTYEDVNLHSYRENKTPKRNISFIGIHH